MTWWISKLLNWPGNSGGTYHNYHQNYVHKKEPTRHEINELNTMIDRFGSNINVKEFEEHILNYLPFHLIHSQHYHLDYH